MHGFLDCCSRIEWLFVEPHLGIKPKNDNGYLDHFLFRDIIRPFILGFNKTIVFGSDVVDAEFTGDGLYRNGDLLRKV